jgi:hypothetical protein
MNLHCPTHYKAQEFSVLCRHPYHFVSLLIADGSRLWPVLIPHYLVQISQCPSFLSNKRIKVEGSVTSGASTPTKCNSSDGWIWGSHIGSYTWRLYRNLLISCRFRFCERSRNIVQSLNVKYLEEIISSLLGSGSVVGWGTMLQAGRSRFRVPMRWIFYNLPNP